MAAEVAFVTCGNKGIEFAIFRNQAGAGCAAPLGARKTDPGRQAVHQLQQADL